ncbi:MAG: class I SAM-dependent methyltransferase, partial [Myxococcota bacterium]|nr:class I SAM-dependent methyltransferase [Myxococcota bacterium]
GTEVAHAPDRRRTRFGPAPPAAAVLDLVRHVLATAAPAVRAPASAREWAQLWEDVPPTALPWHTEILEPALTAALGTGQGRHLLDLGTGAGTVAIAAARAGYVVTATDVAPAALAVARQRAGDLVILFALDDVTRSALTGGFDVVADRGVLHGLPPSMWPAYAATVTRLVADGGRLLLIAHTATGARGTRPVDEATVAALLPGFVLGETTALVLAGGDARLYTLVRRASVTS